MLSVNGLPDTYSETCTCIINDWDLDVVVRNITILLAAFVLPPEVAPTAMLHFWYSARLPMWLPALIGKYITPLVADVCDKIRDKAPTTLQGKTFQFGISQVRVVLQKSQWDTYLSVLTRELNIEAAGRSRADVVLAPSTVDFVDRTFTTLKGFQRVAFMRQRRSGILSSFASSDAEFTMPNT